MRDLLIGQLLPAGSFPSTAKISHAAPSQLSSTSGRERQSCLQEDLVKTLFLSRRTRANVCLVSRAMAGPKSCQQRSLWRLPLRCLRDDSFQGGFVDNHSRTATSHASARLPGDGIVAEKCSQTWPASCGFLKDLQRSAAPRSKICTSRCSHSAGRGDAWLPRWSPVWMAMRGGTPSTSGCGVSTINTVAVGSIMR